MYKHLRFPLAYLVAYAECAAVSWVVTHWMSYPDTTGVRDLVFVASLVSWIPLALPLAYVVSFSLPPVTKSKPDLYLVP